MSQVAVDLFGDNWPVPFPAVPLPVSFAIGIPVALAAFVAQEVVLRRRRTSRPPRHIVDDPESHLYESLHGSDVTTPDAADVKGDVVDLREVAPQSAPVPAKPRVPRARRARAEASVAPESEQMADVVPAVTPPQTARSRKRPAAAPGQRAAADSTAVLGKRRAALNVGLEAIIDFVDGPARRAAATACADALLLAVPKTQRGPDLEAFLHAAGAKRPPSQLQEMAEDAGVEVATAIKEVNVKIRALTSS